jgi:hypothetical protein
MHAQLSFGLLSNTPGTYQESSYYTEAASDIAMRDAAALRRQVDHSESFVYNNLADSSLKPLLTSRARPEGEINETRMERDGMK